MGTEISFPAREAARSHLFPYYGNVYSFTFSLYLRLQAMVRILIPYFNYALSCVSNSAENLKKYRRLVIFRVSMADMGACLKVLARRKERTLDKVF